MVKISKIFKWFGEDLIEGSENTELFNDRDAKDKAVLNFVTNHLKSDEQKAFLENDQFKFSYLDYDWSLNELKISLLSKKGQTISFSLKT